jgi:hypothetical protein
MTWRWEVVVVRTDEQLYQYSRVYTTALTDECVAEAKSDLKIRFHSWLSSGSSKLYHVALGAENIDDLNSASNQLVIVVVMIV